MSYQFSTLCYVRLLSGIFALILVGLLWKQRHSKGAVYLMLFEIAAAIWAIGDGFEAAAVSLTAKLAWAQFAYIGVSTSAVMFLMFSLTYTNRLRFVNLKTFLLLMVIPFLTIIMALTNTFHRLLWSDVVFLSGTNQCVYYYGPYFWINIFYEYSALLAGIIILLIGVFKVYSIHRVQILVLLIGTILPFIASILYVFKLFPVKGLDPTPVSFILTGILVTIGLYWFRMFSIIPIARKQTLENLRDGMLVIDSVNRIVDVNPAFCRIAGKQSKNIIGSQADSVFLEMNIDLNEFSAENDFTVDMQVVINSELQEFEVKCHLVSDKDKKVIGKIFIFADNTLKKMIANAIADSNRQRKIEIIEKEKLILDLDAYARSVAHDLKNPISSVISLCDLIRLSLSENKQNEAIEMVGLVRDQNKMMIRIIDGLLLLSRIRKEDIKIIPIDMRKIMEEVRTRLHDEIVIRKAILEIPEQWPEVLGYELWIEEVWVNLFSNALKYGGDPPVIKIGFEKSSPSEYGFWIHDNGNGLSADSLEKIFEDFERLGLKDTGGHGLGLPIVRRIIEKLSGEVKVTSSNKPGEGCTFSFTLKMDTKNRS
jgi:PAS domain S-box-containing protein